MALYFSSLPITANTSNSGSTGPSARYFSASEASNCQRFQVLPSLITLRHSLTPSALPFEVPSLHGVSSRQQSPPPAQWVLPVGPGNKTTAGRGECGKRR